MRALLAAVLIEKRPLGSRSGLRENGHMRAMPPPKRRPSQCDTIAEHGAHRMAPTKTGRKGSEPVCVGVPAAISEVMQGNGGLRKANNSPNAVMNMTAMAQS